MKEQELTELEKRYLNDLRNIQRSVRSRVLGWVMELIPSIGLFLYGLVSNQRLFLVLGFLSLLYFAVWRMYSQFRGFRMMQSIFNKQLSAEAERDA